MADEADIEMGGTRDGHHQSHGNGPTGSSSNSVPPVHTASVFEVKSETDEKPSQQLSSSSSSQPQQPPPASSQSPTPATGKMKPGLKKKGTAAAKKAAPRSRKKAPKAAKSSASAASKGRRRSSAAAAAADEEDPEDEEGGDGDGDEEDDETDNGPYCICRGPDDHRWMIGCDVCEDWFHGECVSLTKEVGEKLVERFVCPNCTDKAKGNYTKYKKTCSFAGCLNPARLYGTTGKTGKKKNEEADEGSKSVFCSDDHCQAWWLSIISTMPSKTAAKRAVEVLTREDFVALLASSSTADENGWKLGDKPFGNIEGLWSNGLPTREGVLSEEEVSFLKTSAAERLALGNEIVQYKKMMQLLDWASERRQAAIEAGAFTKDSCGYDWRLDTVTVRAQFAVWLDTPEGQAVFKMGRLDTPLPVTNAAAAAAATAATGTASSGSTGENNAAANGNAGAAAAAAAAGEKENPLIAGTCDRKRCKPHNGWYKVLMGAVRVLIKETAKSAASKLEAEDTMRSAAAARYERRKLEKNTVERVS